MDSKNKISQVTAVGSAALDTIQTPCGRVEETLGGSVFYIGAVAGLFAPTHIVAVVGDDFNLNRIDFLKNRNVNLDGLEVAPGRTFRWEGFYPENMNQRDTRSVELGVFEGFNPQLPLAAAEAEFLLLANIDPTLQLNVLNQAQNPRLVAFDTMNHWIRDCRQDVLDIMSKVDLVFLNDEEAYLLTGRSNPLQGAHDLLKTGPQYIVIKKGEHGAILVGRGMPPFLCPAYPVEQAVDPTGAGDTFAGAMIGYLAHTGDLGAFNMRRAVVYGTVAASFTVEGFGLERLENIVLEQLHQRSREFQAMVEF
ncbi:MAG: PfkB family carbohydrate kinase [Calditrichota bacterium]